VAQDAAEGLYRLVDAAYEKTIRRDQLKPAPRRVPRRQVGESGALELGDALLDDRVAAVVGLDFDEVAWAVGDEGVVVPGGEQRDLDARCFLLLLGREVRGGPR